MCQCKYKQHRNSHLMKVYNMKQYHKITQCQVRNNNYLKILECSYLLINLFFNQDTFYKFDCILININRNYA